MKDDYQVRVEMEFSAGHRLLGHNGKCIHPHGHNYKVEIFMVSHALNSVGFVVDFSELKQKVSSWIDANWDHAFLLNSKDGELLEALRSVKEQFIYLFDGVNPSAEVMAREIYRKIEELCGIEPAAVRMWESSTQYAEYRSAS